MLPLSHQNRALPPVTTNKSAWRSMQSVVQSLDRNFQKRASQARQSVARSFAPLLASATAIATPRKKLKVWKLRLPLVFNLVLILGFVLLDIQDLLYKIMWVGPYETFAFKTEVTGVLRDSVLVPFASETGSVGERDDEHHVSSWPHFLSSCVNLAAFDAGGGFFAIAEGQNCTVSSGNSTKTLEHVILASSVRLDSIVWTACKLLFQSQQPFICRSPIVGKYLRRYVLPDISVNISSLAKPDSDAEKELLAFLDMVSRSHSLSKMVCVEAFEWANRSTGVFKPTLLGCASPNIWRSEFVGLLNPALSEFHRGRAWLTSDVFHWFGLRFAIRQNARSAYWVEPTEDGSLRATGRTTPNFSCYGPLYSLMILLDFLLLAANVCSYWQFAERVLLPRSNELVRRHRRQLRDTVKILPRATRRRFAQVDLIKKPAKRNIFRSTVKLSAKSSMTATLVQPSWVPVEHLDVKELRRILPCSLQRSWPGIFAVIVSQLLSWMIIMPNSVVWVWGLSLFTKVQAFLTSLRVWMLLVVTFNFLWDCFVKVSEEYAYYVTSRTFITPLEIIVVGGAVAAWKRLDIFLMCERKWQIENQRVNDSGAFKGGYIAHGNTYQPSVELLVSTPSKIVAILFGPLTRIIGMSILLLIGYAALKGIALQYFGKPKAAELLLAGSDPSKNSYKRLPMEEETNCPIRAKSLVRQEMMMEHTFLAQQFIRPCCYLECGLLPLQTRFTTRVGFTNFLPLKYQKRARILQAKEWKLE
ncbi:hypothetical protein PybrP1_012254 [[Pythium] brassicae (nom. inval.)]|nr:hypothetical protein PybrP1_012254 [[Pythium] brassicae (nom. inval.)]